MISVLYAYLYCTSGGVSSVIRERRRADATRQMAVTCCFRKDGGGRKQLIDLGARVRLRDDYIGLACEEAEQRKVDSFHLVDEASYVPRIRQLFSGQLVLEVHTSTPRFLDQITDEVAAMVDLILVPSEWSRSQVESRLRRVDLYERIQVLPNIAMTPTVPDPQPTPAGGLGETDPCILWVGKLVGGKNWLDALRIFDSVRQSARCRMVVVTGGEISRETYGLFVKELIALGLDRVVDWRHGVSRDTMSAIYRETAASRGALLVTSLAESFGLVLVESLAHGLPVFASHTHALPELVRPGVNGMLFPVGNTSHAVAALRSLVSGELRFDQEQVRSSVPAACHPDKHMTALLALVRKGVARRDPRNAIPALRSTITDYSGWKLPRHVVKRDQGRPEPLADAG